MKRRTKELIRRIIAVILIISLMPYSDFINCFTITAHAAEPEEIDVSVGDVSVGDVSTNDAPDVEQKQNILQLTDNHTLTEDTVVDGVLLQGGTLDLNGYSLTVQGDLQQSGGILFVDGGSLIIEGNYTAQSDNGTESAGLLRMTDEADTVSIGGDFYYSSNQNSSGYLTAGTLEVQGDFTVENSKNYAAFIASDSHKVRLSGNGLQTVDFAQSYHAYSRFCNLEITNTSSEGVSFCDDQPIYIVGNINDNGSTIFGYISIVTSTSFTEGYYGGNVCVTTDYAKLDDTVTFGKDLKIEEDTWIPGIVTVQGNVYQNEGCLLMQYGSLVIEGDYVLSDGYGTYLSMENNTDYVHVYGDVSFNPYQNNQGNMTAGTFEVEGDFFSGKNLYATKDHRFVFSGRTKQTIQIADGCYFATVELNNESQEGVWSAEPFNYKKLVANGNQLSYGEYEGVYGWTLKEDTTHEGDLVLHEGILDLNGHSLTVTGDLVQISGTVAVNGGSLTVAGDYRMQSRKPDPEATDAYLYGKSAGRLKMTNNTDYVLVQGDFISDTCVDTTGDFTAGTLEVRGDVQLIGTYSQKAFWATGNHKLLLSGETTQQINFKQHGTDRSQICNLEITGAGVVIVPQDSMADSLYVAGKINDHGNAVDGYITIDTSTTFPEGSFGGSVYIDRDMTLDDTVHIAGDMRLCDYRTILLTGDVKVDGNLYQEKCELKFENGRLEVGGDYKIVNIYRSALHMSHEADYFYVCGNVEYTPYYAWESLTAGTFEVGGNLTANGNLKAGGTHKFLFSGTEKQIITVPSDAYFATVELQNDSAEGVYSDTTFVKQKLITNGCRITYGDLEGEYGWKLDKDTIYEGDLTLLEDTLDLNGYSLTVTGNLKQMSGTVFINGGKLIVEGDYILNENKPTGQLQMTNEKDHVLIKGSYLSDAAANSTGYLTAGVLEVWGDVLVGSNYSSNNFVATGSHTLLLSGKKLQTVRFGVSGTNSSRICNLEITNTSEEGVFFDSAGKITDGMQYFTKPTYVTGNVIDHGNQVSGVIGIIPSTTFENGSFGGGISISQSMTLDDTLHIGGNMQIIDCNGNAVMISSPITVDGSFYMNTGNLYMEQGSLEVMGNFYMRPGIYSKLEMRHEQDTIHVHGNVEYAPYFGESYYLTAGTFEVGGNFTATKSLKASGTHRFVFSGNAIQTIDIADEAFFAVVEFQNYGEEGIYADAPFSSSKLIANGCRVTYGDKTGLMGWTLKEDTIYEGDLTLMEGTLDLNGYKLTVKGNLEQVSGTVYVHGGELVVEGNYLLEDKSAGRLQMTHSEDIVRIYGSYICDGCVDGSGYLTEGRMEIGGDFLVGNTYCDKCFVATGNHTVVLNGESGQRVSFARSTEALSGVNHLEIANNSAEGVLLDSNTAMREGLTYHQNALYVRGNVDDGEGVVKGFIGIGSTTTFTDGSFAGGVVIGQRAIIDEVLSIGGDMEITSGYDQAVTILGQLTVAGNYLQPLGDLKMENGSLEVAGDFIVKKYIYNHIEMMHGDDYIHVHGNVFYDAGNGSTYYMSAGTFEVGGNLTANRFLQAGGTHRFLFSGTQKQTICLEEGSYFATIELANYSAEGVYSETVFKRTTLIRNGCKIRFGTLAGEYGWTLTEDCTYEGDLVLLEDTLDLNGYHLTVTGDLIQTAGTVVLNGGSLTVEGDYRLQSRSGSIDNYTYTGSVGQLVMTNASDRLTVCGDFIFQPTKSTHGKLTAGNMELKGDFTQLGSYAFQAKDSHTVIFSGDKVQAWKQATAGTVGNVINRNSRKLTISSSATVYGNLTDETGTVTGSGILSVAKTSQLMDGIWSGRVNITGINPINGWSTGAETLTRPLQVGTLFVGQQAQLSLGGYGIIAQDITLNGRLNLDEGQVLCSNHFTVAERGTLTMQKPEGTLVTGGNFYIYSIYNHEGLLTDGTLELRGHFIQDDYINFVATGNHTTVLARKHTTNGNQFVQNITFNKGAGTTRFNRLVLRKNIENYLFKNEIETIANEITYEIEDATAPEAIASILVTETTESSVTITFSEAIDEAGIAGYEIYRDGVYVGTTTTTSYTDTGLLPARDYAYEVYPFDAYRNLALSSPKVVATTAEDTQFPQAPGNVSIYTRTGSSITLTWSPATDNVGVTGYRIYRNGVEIASNIKTTRYKDTNLQENTVYRYHIVACDTTGNVSADSETVEAVVAMPEILEITPADHSAIGGGEIPITVRLAKVGNEVNNRVRIETLSENGEWTKVTPTDIKAVNDDATSQCVKYNWIIESLEGDKDYTLRVTLFDADGNTDVQKVVYHIDRQAPEFPTDFTAQSDNGIVNLYWEPSVSADCAGYKLYRMPLNSESEDAVYELLAINVGAYETFYTDRSATEGIAYSYVLKTYDTFGNTSVYSDAVTVTVAQDESAPQVKTITPKAGRVGGITTITVGASDNRSVAKVKLFYRPEQGVEWTEFARVAAENNSAVYEWDTSALTDGIYMINAVAVDGSGNESTEEFTRRYEVDNTGIAKLQIKEPKVLSTAVQLAWEDVTEPDFAYFQVEQLVGEVFVKIGTTEDTLGYNITNLSPSTSYTFQVVGYDNLGNRGEASDAVTVTTGEDRVAPTIDAIYPVSAGYKDTIELAVEASDNDAISQAVFSMSLNGTDYQALATVDSEVKKQTARLEYELDITTLPEGKIYIKFEVYDKAGNKNALLSDGSEVIAEYTVDRTAPAKVENLTVINTAGSVGLSFSGSAKDAKTYKIYRMDSTLNVYKTIEEACYTTTFYDTTVSAGATYTYKVTAVDEAGNESDYSEEVLATVQTDQEVPVITGMSPEDKSLVGANAVITAAATDNGSLSHMTLEYRQGNGTDLLWRTIDEIPLRGRGEMAEFEWNTKGLAEGEYLLRAVAWDDSGNASAPMEVIYTLDTTAPAQPIVQAVTGHFEITLQIQGGTETDFDYYEITRREAGTQELVSLGQWEENTYTDRGVKPDTVYLYQVTAYDTQGNLCVSEEAEGCADSVDVVNPIAILPENLMGMAGMELAFDGMGSTDNVRIVNFKWNMGDGTLLTGAQPVYAYDEPGNYTVTLTVSDGAGNSASATTTVRVYAKDGYGTHNLTVVDEKGNPIPYATVYLREGDSYLSLQADGEGSVAIVSPVGTREVAAYKSGYLPDSGYINISDYQTLESTLVLTQEELIVGNLTTRRLTLQEMADAGVDFSDPRNMHTVAFSFTAKFTESAIPVEVYYVFTEHSKRREYEATKVNPHSDKKEGKCLPDFQPIKVIENGENLEPIFAYVTTSQSVSWLKDMYEVNLGIFNAADNRFVIEDAMATLNLPASGVSLAATINGQSLTQSMGSIAGQENKTVSWIVKGDKTGSYNLSADFNGVLMPFEEPVSACFKTEQEISVTTGEGIHIYISPESEAYIGEQYYIQFAIVNESEKPIYNFTTSIGAFSAPSQTYHVTDLDTGEVVEGTSNVIISDPSTVSQAVVVQNGQEITINTLYPGQSFYGTYCTSFSQPAESTANPDEVYYSLVEYFVDILSDSNLGVTISVTPGASHVSRYKVRTEVVPSFYGDPIDLATGAFTESMDVMSIPGGTQLTVGFDYNSRLAGYKGELGYGWSHNYEYRVEEYNGIVKFYTGPDYHVSFIKADAMESYFYGEVAGDNALIAQGKEYSYGDYTCLYGSMTDYKLTKHRDDTYTVTAPNGFEYRFDSAGRLIKLVDETGKSVSLSHSGGTTTITEDISGKRIYINYNGTGLVDSVSDDNGREITISYDENENISSITNVLGETVNYSYDESHRMVSESGREGTIVTNAYDEEGRVIRQTDAFGQVMTLEYTTDESGNTTVTVHDPDGTTKKQVVDNKGQVIQTVNGDGGKISYAYDAEGNLISETDPEGNVIFKEYDSRGNLIQVTDTGNITTTMTYDDRGNLLTISGTEDRAASYTYDSRNLMTSMTDSAGMVTTYGYDENGQLVRETVEGLGSMEYTYVGGLIHTIKDYNGNVTTTEYDSMGNPVRTIDSQGNVTEKVYDKLGHVLQTTDAMGNTTSYTYDYLGNVATMTDAMGHTVTYQYDKLGRKTRETYPDGTFTDYGYDIMGRCNRVTYADGTSGTYAYNAAGYVTKETLPDGSIKSYTYDLLGNMTSETDAAGNTIQYVYYPNGNLQKVIYPDGSSSIQTYSQAWKVNSVTDTMGSTSSYKYDAKSRLIEERDALGNIRSYEYDLYGRLVSETDANGNKTTYEFDANSNCIQKTNALGVSVYMEYDSLNRMTRAYTKTKSGEEYSVSYTYDALGRVISTTDEMGNTTTVSYDKMGNVISTTDADGVVTQTATYDEMGRTTSVTDALGVETRYQYDTMGNVLAVVEVLNSGNRTTSYTYDKLGRMTSVTDPLSGVTKATYDKQGNIATLTDANGGVTKYTYDSMGQLIAAISPLGNQSTYTYNAGGLLTESKNARGQATTYKYDAVGRITSMTDELGTVHYTYDPNGNILTTTDDQGTISRKYDALNRVTEYTDYKGNTVKYSYDEIGNLISLTYPGGEIVRYSYYKNGWLHTVTDAKGNVTKYSYDARGNLTHTQRPNGTEEICTYNAAGLLVGQKDICGEEVLTEYTYTYDDNGNVTAIDGTETTDTEEGISRLSSAKMTYDAENRLITYNGETLRYDADGNMTYGPVNGVMSELVYDCRNRLVSAGGIRYTYDAENNRIAMETDSYREEYVTDTVSASLSRVLIITHYEKDSTEQVGSKSQTTLCIYGRGLVYEYTGDIYLYHHYNNLGSTMKLSDASGQVIASYTYGVYGELLSGDAGLTRFLYNGRYGVTTDDNGLYYMRQRYYNPEIKRFVNQDILTGSMDSSQSLNRYSYVQGNPISYVDPFGLSPLDALYDMGEQALGVSHMILGVGSMLPGPVGMVASAIDAVFYAVFDKDYYNAAFCALGALSMGFGNIAGKATQGTFRAVSAAVAEVLCDGISTYLTFTDPRNEGKFSDLEVLGTVALTTVFGYASLRGAFGKGAGRAASNAMDQALDSGSDARRMFSRADDAVGDVASAGKKGSANVLGEVVENTLESGTPSTTAGFDDWLGKGATDNKVYFGIKDGTAQYTGITKQTKKARLNQHNNAGKGFDDLDIQYEGLTRNQARAIEQYYIENGPNTLNKINSISPNNKYYQDAMNWAKQYLGVE